MTNAISFVTIYITSALEFNSLSNQVAAGNLGLDMMEKYIFPPANAVTEEDRRYFDMIGREAEWGESNRTTQIRTEASEARHGLPDSNSLTQVDREYFNIIKTEDGVSQFYKYFNSIPKPKSDEMKNNLSISEKHPRFRFHIIKPTDAKSSGSKPIVGIYLANAGN